MASGFDRGGLVFVVDDDEAMREATGSLLRSIGLRVQAFATAAAFLESSPTDDASCLVLDVRMPGIGGLDLQHELARRGRSPPIVFVTGHGDVPMAVRAMKAGAVEFLIKPVREQDLLDAVQVALERDRVEIRARAELTALRSRHASLTEREKEVLTRITRGMRNKQVAAELGLSEVTVKLHRHRLMEKMAARTLADLVTMYGRLGEQDSSGRGQL